MFRKTEKVDSCGGWKVTTYWILFIPVYIKKERLW